MSFYNPCFVSWMKAELDWAAVVYSASVSRQRSLFLGQEVLSFCLDYLTLTLVDYAWRLRAHAAVTPKRWKKYTHQNVKGDHSRSVARSVYLSCERDKLRV